MRWAIAIVVLLVVLLVGSVAMAATRSPFVEVATFPPDRWGKTPRKPTDAKRVWLRGFVDQVRPVLEELDQPPSVAIGQAAVETGWGGAGRNNPWGQRGAGDQGSDKITTHEEFEPGVKVKQTEQAFARYSSPVAAAKGYARFLDGASYRPAAAWRRSDPGRWLLWLWGMGYATASSYASSVVDASRRAAVDLDDPTLAVPWTEAHADIARQLGRVKAGSERRALARQLLRPAVA